MSYGFQTIDKLTDKRLFKNIFYTKNLKNTCFDKFMETQTLEINNLTLIYTEKGHIKTLS